MACFTAPATVAIVTTITKKKVSPQYHIEWLNAMLWGGVVMLIIEHIAHGEVVFFPPFFTAMRSSADIMVMIKEIATVGVSMTLAIFAAWLVIVLIANKLEGLRENKNIIATN